MIITLLQPLERRRRRRRRRINQIASYHYCPFVVDVVAA
jgi:hypothetical protein